MSNQKYLPIHFKWKTLGGRTGYVVFKLLPHTRIAYCAVSGHQRNWFGCHA